MKTFYYELTVTERVEYFRNKRNTRDLTYIMVYVANLNVKTCLYEHFVLNAFIPYFIGVCSDLLIARTFSFPDQTRLKCCDYSI